MANEENLLEEYKAPETETGYFKKLFLSFIDGAVVMGTWYLLYRYLPYEIQMNSIRAVPPTLVAFLLLLLYRVIAMFGFKQTIGMLLFKVKLLTKEQQELSKTQRWMATFLVFMNEIKYFDKK